MTGFLVFPVIPFSLPDFLRWENGKIKKKNWEIKTEGDKDIINLTNWGTAIRILRIDFFFLFIFEFGLVGVCFKTWSYHVALTSLELMQVRLASTHNDLPDSPRITWGWEMFLRKGCLGGAKEMTPKLGAS